MITLEQLIIQGTPENTLNELLRRLNFVLESSNINNTNINNNITQVNNEINDIRTEQADIVYLVSQKAQIEDLQAVQASVDDLYANKATVAELIASNARISELEATRATIEQLNAVIADIENLQATKADITELNAVIANIESLFAETANINTLLAGNLTAENMQAGFITAESGLIAEGAILNAMIKDISADKINTGTINTNNVNIRSESGNLVIYDNTIQISDDDRVRVQIGKDASDDYNIYIWDVNGNLMFDATGLKADGIKDAIIRDDMVSETANISGSKLNISSLFTAMNNSTSTLKSSRIFMDDLEQTLDIVFNTLSETVSEQGELITSQGTAISVIQGQITNKIWQQDIDTATGIIDTQISAITQQLGSIELSVSEMESEISDIDSRVTTAEGSITTLAGQITLKADASTVSSLSSQLSQALIDIDALEGEIVLKVTQTEVDAALDAAKNYSDAQLSILSNSVIAEFNIIGLGGAQTGIIKFDVDGQEVLHSNINAMTRLSADGLRIFDMTDPDEPIQIGGLMVIDGKVRNISSVLSNPDIPDFYAVIGDVEVEGVLFPAVSFYHTANGQTKPFLQFASSGAVGNTGWLEFFARYGRRVDELILFNDMTRLNHFVDDEFNGAIQINWVHFNGNIRPRISIIRSDNETAYDVWHTGDLVTLEGEVSISGSMAFGYPDGFDKDSTLVLAVKVDNGSIIRNVTPSAIEYDSSDIYMNSSYFVSGNTVYIAIMKI